MLRRQVILRKRKSFEHIWPIDENSGHHPQGWSGWPDNKRFALVLTHDVDTFKGHENCERLVDLEKSLGFVSSFNFVPERYDISRELRQRLRDNGFEVGVHGLKHDGKLYSSKKVFRERVIKINHYLEEWESVGFRSPSMHHNLEWLHDLNIEYDASTFDTDPFEPQSDGMATIFPFLVYRNPDVPAHPAKFRRNSEAYSTGLSRPYSFPASQRPSFFIELPYTLPQDSTVFVLMRERDISIWKQKLDWIAKKGGMALLNAHPDYMSFDGNNPRIEYYPVEYYVEFLAHIKTNYKGQYWHVLPKNMARFWASSSITA